jgi:uncharacterized SAM-binding protein YcdF (DUF218 family)
MAKGKQLNQSQRLSMSKTEQQAQGWLLWAIILVGALAFGVGYKVTKHHLTQPQALLVLGGEPKREKFAAEMARHYPYLPIWVSSGSNREYAEWVFIEAGIARTRLRLDYHAVDTVTNFTTLIEQLQKHKIKSVYLITSDDHMPRARVVGEIILGSRGIEIRPLPIPSGRQPESINKVLRDAGRAVLWVLTGRTGTTFGHSLPLQP